MASVLRGRYPLLSSRLHRLRFLRLAESRAVEPMEFATKTRPRRNYSRRDPTLMSPRRGLSLTRQVGMLSLVILIGFGVSLTVWTLISILALSQLWSSNLPTPRTPGGRRGGFTNLWSGNSSRGLPGGMLLLRLSSGMTLILYFLRNFISLKSFLSRILGRAGSTCTYGMEGTRA
ncbi:hypothetical protein LCGC14_0389750 [marine sediment metagenome]|uniref:Uncharacterized protein n=1 Tax=marine sediment metagenome TaxID=412755 RepID=A0A0F9W905_9ZZZZ